MVYSDGRDWTITNGPGGPIVYGDDTSNSEKPGPVPVGGSSVPNTGDFGGETWQDGIRRRLHHGCNEDELAEARYHDRMREEAWRAKQKAPAPAPPVRTVKPIERRPRLTDRQKYAEYHSKVVTDFNREYEKVLADSSIQFNKQADEFNAQMHHQLSSMESCREQATVGGYSSEQRGHVDIIEMSVYEDCLIADRMPKVRINVPPGHVVTQDKETRKLVVNQFDCLTERFLETVSHGVVGAAGGFAFTNTYAGKSPYKPILACGSAVVSGIANAARGWRSAGRSEACQPQPQEEN